MNNQQLPETFQDNQKLPNEVLIIVFGVLSMVTCCFWGAGLIFGGIALYLAIQATKQYKQNPERYINYSNINIGKILSIIGIVFSIIFIIYLIWLISTFGWETLRDQELLEERLREYFGQ